MATQPVTSTAAETKVTELRQALADGASASRARAIFDQIAEHCLDEHHVTVNRLVGLDDLLRLAQVIVDDKSHQPALEQGLRTLPFELSPIQFDILFNGYSSTRFVDNLKLLAKHCDLDAAYPLLLQAQELRRTGRRSSQGVAVRDMWKPNDVEQALKSAQALDPLAVPQQSLLLTTTTTNKRARDDPLDTWSQKKLKSTAPLDHADDQHSDLDDDGETTFSPTDVAMMQQSPSPTRTHHCPQQDTPPATSSKRSTVLPYLRTPPKTVSTTNPTDQRHARHESPPSCFGTDAKVTNHAIDDILQLFCAAHVHMVPAASSQPLKLPSTLSSDVTLIVVPLHHKAIFHNNPHWSIAFIDLHAPAVTHYDSLRSPLVLQDARAQLRPLLASRENLASCQVLQCNTTHVQTDSTSCGIHILAFALLHLTRQPPSDLVDTFMWRRFLASLLGHNRADTCGPAKDLIIAPPTMDPPLDVSPLTAAATLANHIKTLKTSLTCLEHRRKHVGFFSTCLSQLGHLRKELSTSISEASEERRKINDIDLATLSVIPGALALVEKNKKLCDQQYRLLLGKQERLENIGGDHLGLCDSRLQKDDSVLRACHKELGELLAGIHDILGLDKDVL